ncbi:dolichyl-diphosphooligosaccharide--protein glycosyltransferase subunit TUSC3-like [Babylonia areolata]|uniref:dolichyl-diphosphooligosaccharide--protein glycosyltransferase subunit TUSC3-like n=1 Tax=Babylonia areolata TaxID=304850 RepID=UPI003FD65483
MTRLYGWIVTICLVTLANTKLKKEDTLADRVHRLTDLNKKDSVIRLKGDRFYRYVVAGPRNYSVIILLTASQSDRKCPMCKEAQEEFKIVANSWHSSKEYCSKMFFAMADVDEAPEVFEHLRMNIAPVFVHYPSKGKPKKTDIMEIQRLGFAAEQIVRFVAERTQILIRIVRPPNYTSMVCLALLVCVVAALLYVKRNSLHFLTDPTGWAVSVLMMIFAMTSGQMWNQILKPPPMYKNPQTGETHFIYADFQGQFVFETYLVIFLHIL